MANPGISKVDAKKFVELVEQKLREGYPPMGTSVAGVSGALSEATNELNIPRSSGSSKRQAAERIFRKIDWEQYKPAGEPQDKPIFDLPVFPDEDIDVGAILDHLSRRFEKKLENEDAKTWFDVNVRIDGPVGLAVVGDPHLGTHCNIPLLRRDIDIMANTEGMMAVNIGDTADNWGRMIYLYAEDDISKPTERKLARWFLRDAGVPWVVWLHGNHDTMHGEFSTFLKTVNVAQIPMIDWRAKFKLKFPSGGEVKIDAAHNHKGTSIYNRLHGQKRAALFDEDADIYVAGHHHTWGLTHEELDDGRVVWQARARGYKWIDEYATRHNFHRDEHGSTILFVIDPGEGNAVKRITAFADLEEGADFLTWKRSRVS
tara:strand:+ start:465 stop:1583 length:1119 start_codon:yes stop_codon:yes gene_type:complete